MSKSCQGSASTCESDAVRTGDDAWPTRSLNLFHNPNEMPDGGRNDNSGPYMTIVAFIVRANSCLPTVALGLLGLGRRGRFGRDAARIVVTALLGNVAA